MKLAAKEADLASSEVRQKKVSQKASDSSENPPLRLEPDSTYNYKSLLGQRNKEFVGIIFIWRCNKPRIVGSNRYIP